MNAIQQMVACGATHIDTEDLDCNPWMKRDINGWLFWDDEYDNWEPCFTVDEHNLLPLPGAIANDPKVDVWADAPKGTTHLDLEDQTISKWLRFSDGQWFHRCDEKLWLPFVPYGPDKEHYIVHPTPDDQPAPYWADEPENEPTWDGQGLPPVGIECEVCTNDDSLQWQKVTILAHDEHRAIFRDPLNKSIPTVYDWGSAACFRPLPTPDARRAEVVKQAWAIWNDIDDPDPSLTEMLERLYDNGLLCPLED